jgi:hypothetical protein
MDEFNKASGDIMKEIDQTGFDAGRSLGGIHGKAAFEAMTADNKNIETYNPGVSEGQKVPWKKIAKYAACIGILISLVAILWHVIN